MVSIRDLWLDMKSILRSARQIINRGLAPLNLSSAEGDILFHLLTGSNHVQQEQLAEQLDIGKAAISRAIDSLVSKGYVKRVRQSEDRRAYSISLTDKAFLAGDHIVDIYHRLYTLVKKGIADAELSHVESLLSRVLANLHSSEADNGT